VIISSAAAAAAGALLTHLETVVRPRAKLHRTALIVEGKIRDVDLTGTAQFGRRRPEHVAVVPYHRLALHKPARVVVRTATVSTTVRHRYLSVRIFYATASLLYRISANVEIDHRGIMHLGFGSYFQGRRRRQIDKVEFWVLESLFF